MILVKKSWISPILDQKQWKTKEIIDFPLFSSDFVKNQWFFNKNHSVLSTLNTSFSKLKQYFWIIYVLLKSSRSETFISDVFHSFFCRIAVVKPKYRMSVEIHPVPASRSPFCLFNSDNLIFWSRFLEKYKKSENKKFLKKYSLAQTLESAILASNSIGEKS